MTDAQVARVREKANGAGAILDIMYNASLTTHVVSVYDAAQLKRWKERVGCAGKTLVFCTPEAFCASREEKTEVKERVLVLRRRMSADDRDAVRAALAQCADREETLEFGPLVQTIVSSWSDAALAEWMARMAKKWRLPDRWTCRTLRPEDAGARSSSSSGERRAIVEWLPGTARVPFMVGSDGAESRLLGFTVGFFSEGAFVNSGSNPASDLEEGDRVVAMHGFPVNTQADLLLARESIRSDVEVGEVVVEYKRCVVRFSADAIV